MHVEKNLKKTLKIKKYLDALLVENRAKLIEIGIKTVGKSR